MLLTSGQVSMAMSSAIVVTFTGLLFLAGYILQQQTLHTLHAAIRPQIPSPRHNHAKSTPTPINPHSRLSRPFGKLRDQLYFHEETFQWDKLAHAQLVRGHDDVCHALILFHDLYRLRSPVPKLLLFPRIWVRERGEDEETDLELETSLRLLKKASRLYRVILVPVGPISKEGNETDPSEYSLASAFSLTNYERVMLLPTPGMILNTRPLDSLLAFSEPEPISTYPQKDIESSILLLKPSIDIFNGFAKLSLQHKQSDSKLLYRTFPTPDPLLLEEDPDFSPSLYTTLSELRAPRTEANPFNGTGFLESTAFIQLTDTELPSPEYDVPYPEIVKRRPKDQDQGYLWERMYSMYKDRRYGVCGLDLEPWPPRKKSAAAVKKEDL